MPEDLLGVGSRRTGIAAPAGAKGGIPAGARHGEPAARGGSAAARRAAGWPDPAVPAGLTILGVSTDGSYGPRGRTVAGALPRNPGAGLSGNETDPGRRRAAATDVRERSCALQHSSLSLVDGSSAECASDSTEPDDGHGTRENPRFPRRPRSRPETFRPPGTSFVVRRCRRRTDGTALPRRDRLIRHRGHEGGGTDRGRRQ